MRKNVVSLFIITILLLLHTLFSEELSSGLNGLQKPGELRHLGVPYAKFNTGVGDGFSVEMMQKFASHLGVKYQYVPTTFASIIPDLTGHPMIPGKQQLDYTKKTEIRGDVISTGFTVLPWRAQLVSFATPIFPTQIWVVVKSTSNLNPIVPAADVYEDIKNVKKLLKGRSVLGKSGTCLDPSLYNLEATGAELLNFEGSVNDLVPAILEDKAEIVLLDVPDALVGLSKWPGKIKILGPLSPIQTMADAFRKEDSDLLEEYELFLKEIKENGEYLTLVKKYYPNALLYFPDFFE